jgi:lysophospholipase L1-like esterase
MLVARLFTFGLILLLAVTMWTGCRQEDDPTRIHLDPEPGLTLLALGDSYTVGHSLPTEWSWPFQLADSLAAAGDSLQFLDVIAQTGWTTRDLLEAVRDSIEQEVLLTDPYGLVTLMIGVNNQFQGVDQRVFEAELDTLIAQTLELAGDDPSRVIGFSIPDYGVTPVGELFGRVRIGTEIEAHNAILARKFGEQGIVMLDVTTLSRRAGDEPELVARDGLHYSRLMYELWVKMMLPAVRSALLPGS